MVVVGINAPVLGFTKLLAIASLSIVVYLIGSVVYNVFFHPLRNFPGPFWWRASRLPYCYRNVLGKVPYDVLEMHKKYGEVVRIAPDELVFANTKAWKDIMGHRGPGQPEMAKADHMYKSITGGPKTILNADREEHSQLRRRLAHGFSDRSLRAQEPIIQHYVNLLIQRLHENCQGGTAPLNAVMWYNFTTFDVIGDLAFGEPFGCLEQSEMHPWVALISKSIATNPWFQMVHFYPWLRYLVLAIMPKGIMKGRDEHLRLTKEKVLKRMSLGAERPDLVEGLLKDKDGLKMSVDQLQMNGDLLLVAGSETTATLLSGVTYLLGCNPGPLKKLTDEVRSAFKSEDEIDFVSVSRLEYMLACLDEAMRVYPPAASGLVRRVNKGGAQIAGHYVPENTVVSQHHYALYRLEKFFTAPEEYRPERWLGDPKFANDDKDVFQPFQIGPRNCLGRNLAYVEMRVILARVLWNFDLAIAEDSKEWTKDQRIFVVWEKQPLNVYLTPRVKA